MSPPLGGDWDSVVVLARLAESSLRSSARPALALADGRGRARPTRATGAGQRRVRRELRAWNVAQGVGAPASPARPGSCPPGSVWHPAPRVPGSPLSPRHRLPLVPDPWGLALSLCLAASLCLPSLLSGCFLRGASEATLAVRGSGRTSAGPSSAFCSLYRSWAALWLPRVLLGSPFPCQVPGINCLGSGDWLGPTRLAACAHPGLAPWAPGPECTQLSTVSASAWLCTASWPILA